LPRRTKIISWFIALALVMACAPAMATPVPPLDPNSINTVIVLTANAAATQTVAAIPPTSTFTITPRNTFTPEPTSTLVPTIVFPTLTPIQRKQYFRVKHDTQLEIYDYRSRTAADDWVGIGLQTPEVVPMFIGTKLGIGTNRTKVDGTWEIFIDSLNGKDKRKLRYLKADNTALFNVSGFPQMESITMGGNVITIVELQGSWGRVNTIDYVNPGALKNMNYKNSPDLIHKFVVVGWNKNKRITYWTNPPPGAIYWPLVSSVPVWIPLDRLEPFPSLPMMVTATVTQEIRKEPDPKAESTGEKFSEGDTKRIVEYYPSGSNVWARLAGGDWIALYQFPNYLTSWKMETTPPPP